MAFLRAMALPAAEPSLFGITDKIRESFKDRCLYYLDVFGATGKA